MTNFTCACIIALGLAGLSACAPRTQIPDDSLISLKLARDVGRLRLKVSATAASAHCYTEDCSKPVERVPVMIRTLDGKDHELGLTGNEGWLEVPFDQLDGLFPVESTGDNQNASVIIDGRDVAHLPVGEIVHRHEVVARTIAQAEQILGLSREDFEGDWWDYSQTVLTQMIDLQMRGEANAELVTLTQRLHERIKRTPKEKLTLGESLWQHVIDTVTGWFSADEDPDVADVPDDLRDQIQNANNPGELANNGLGVPLEYVPKICEVTLGTSGAVAMNLARLSPVPAMVLALFTGIVGKEVESSLVDSCCKIASEFLTGRKAEQCPDDIRHRS